MDHMDDTTQCNEVLLAATGGKEGAKEADRQGRQPQEATTASSMIPSVSLISSVFLS